MAFRNFCRTCRHDFASISAFDRHRTGVHEYLYAEGLELGVEDGRRCLDAGEMNDLGMDVDGAGRWHFPPSPVERERFQTLRESIPA